jgi:hypothetical protein
VLLDPKQQVANAYSALVNGETNSRHALSELKAGKPVSRPRRVSTRSRLE